MGAVVCSSQKNAQTMVQNNENSSFAIGTETRQRLASISSNCSSILGLTILGIANLTDYEKRLIPKIWSDCLEQNIYYCDHSFNRFIVRHPEIEEVLKTSSSADQQQQNPTKVNGQQTSVADDSDQDLVQKEAYRLAKFFNKLINEYDMDEEKIQEACEELGRMHATSAYKHGLQSVHWTSMAQCMIHEYKKTIATMDESVEENEMHLLAWTHFVTAIISTIKEAFDQEISPERSPYEEAFAYTEYFKHEQHH